MRLMQVLDSHELYRKDYHNFNDMIKRDKLELLIEANIEKPYKVIVWAYSKKDEWSEIQEFIL